MNIYTVRDNLKNTIAGKEQMLYDIGTEMRFVGLRDGEGLALATSAKFLKINIGELKRILADVELCIGENEPELYNSTRKDWIEP